MIIIILKMLDFIINLSYYNAVGITIALTTFLGFELLTDRKQFNKNIKQYTESVLYWSANKLVDYKLAYDENIQPYITKFVNYQSDDTLFLNDVYYKKNIINDKIYYSEPHIEDIKISNPFMQFSINVHHLELEIDVTDKLRQFMVVGNIITNDFINAFLYYYEDIDININSIEYSYVTFDCDIITTDKINVKVLDDGYFQDLSNIHDDDSDIDDSDSEDDTDNDSNSDIVFVADNDKNSNSIDMDEDEDEDN